MKKLSVLLVLVILILTLSACGGGTEEPTTEPAVTEPSVSSIIKSAVLQYPASNELFKYNVYDTYVEITEYIGNDSAAEVIVPATLDELPVYVIDYDVFDKCKVQSIVFEDGIYSIHSDFSPFLKKVVLPSTLDFVGSGTFENCYDLESVTIPEGIDSIQFKAFAHCQALEEITIPSTIKSIDSETFAFCLNLKKVNLKPGLTEIGDEAFLGCGKLTTLNIPETVESIGESAFQGTGFETFVIPETVKKVEGGLFTGCEKLKKVTVLNAELEIPVGAYNIYALLFSQCPSDLVVCGKPGSTIAKVAAAEDIYFEVIK